VGTGYADGYPWSLGNRGMAAVGGRRVPVVGRVSMDLITLDVTGVPDELVQPGCLVDLIGPDISLEEVAERAGTINYEILTRLSQRARRVFVGGPAEP
jgi:alanine racemase